MRANAAQQARTHATKLSTLLNQHAGTLPPCLREQPRKLTGTGQLGAGAYWARTTNRSDGSEYLVRVNGRNQGGDHLPCGGKC
eukprot:7386049-Prymnesium_polylepis.1